MSAFRTSLATVILAAACSSRPPPVAPLPPLPRAAAASYLRGKVAAYRGDWDGASEALAAAAAAAPDEAMIAVELARAQIKAKRAPAALATLAEARRRWPHHPQVWLLSGDVLAAGDRVQATQAYLEAIRLEPDDERAYLGLAKIQPPAAAEDTLRILLRHVPGSIDGRYRLAGRLAARNDDDAAIRQFRAVLERDPDHIDARLELARTLRRRGHLDQAIVETRSAFDRSGQAIDIAEELFWLLCEADDRGAAIDLLTLLDDDRSDADALAVAARLWRGLGRLAEARAIAQRIERGHHDAGAIALARIELAAGDRPAVQATLATISEASKLAPEAHRVLAEAALAAGDPSAALAALGTTTTPPADADNDGDPALDTALLAAFALADLGKLAEARAQLAPFEAARDAGERQQAIYARARLAQRAGDVPGALALLEPLIRARPNLVAALNLAGYLLADSNQRLADAERYLRRARELMPGDPEVLDSWGWLRLRQGKAREAVRLLDRAARFAPLEPEILVHLAAAWAADGAPRTAVAALDRAAALGPSPAVQKRIAAVRHTVAGR
ncbi:MAG TPA: tetratricopeptide repeat protein [Kofleriaceae bacterium]|nr:tetratricopeptide repeat protein [Kofleriaceae bacterium]